MSDEFYGLSGKKQALFIQDKSVDLTLLHTKFEECLKSLGFETASISIEPIDNPNTQILSEVKKFLDTCQKAETEKISCLVIVLIGVYISKKLTIDITNEIANRPYFATVPKVLISEERPRISPDGPGIEKLTIPIYADFVWFQYKYSSNVYLTDNLCQYLTQEYFNRYHILDIFTLATNRVKESLEEKGKTSFGALEIDLPCYKSSLTKLLKLS